MQTRPPPVEIIRPSEVLPSAAARSSQTIPLNVQKAESQGRGSHETGLGQPSNQRHYGHSESMAISYEQPSLGFLVPVLYSCQTPLMLRPPKLRTGPERNVTRQPMPPVLATLPPSRMLRPLEPHHTCPLFPHGNGPSCSPSASLTGACLKGCWQVVFS